MDGILYHLLLALLLLVITAAVFACWVIYNRRRRSLTQAKAAKEAQTTVIGIEQPVAAQEPQVPAGEKIEPILVEGAPQAVLEEVQRRAIQEAQRVAMPETSPVAVEEAQFIVAQEAQREAEEETQQPAAEQVQSTTPEVTQPAPGGKRLPPIKRGGRPRGSAADLEKQPSRKPKRDALKPEIVCWKRERQWVLAVEVPEELLGKPGLTVLQNGLSLSQDKSEEARWCLNQVSGEVIVRWNEDDAKETRIGLGQGNYLLFKLSGQNLDEGRLVKTPSSGSYLAVIPEAWERDERLSGLPPAAPEPVMISGYQAHFFDLEGTGSEKIAFCLPDGQSLVIEPQALRFELVGHRLEDASDRTGPLFGNEPPRIRAESAQEWEDVSIIIIGEEGSGRGRWRTEFSPDSGQTEQALPFEVAYRKCGWYFLRFYNNDADLIESMDFRFLSVLKEIRICQPSPLPDAEGHKPVCVELLHEINCVVQPVSSLANIPIEPQGEKTVLTIPPHPACDESRWLVGLAEGPRVEVTIHVERIWWCVGEENTPPSEWQDRPVVLSREDFQATSSKALWLRLPKRRWVDKVLVGFKRSNARSYDVKVAEKMVAVPLREFGDCVEVSDRTQQHWRIWIQRDDQETEGVLALLPASQVSAAPVSAAVLPSTAQYLLELDGKKPWLGLGRKKSAVAKVVMQKGAGEIKINGRHMDDYFRQVPRKAKQFLERLLDLREVREVLSQMEVNITVEGSSPTTTQQAKAVAHAVARALISYDRNLTAVLKQAGFGGVRVKDSEAVKGGKR